MHGAVRYFLWFAVCFRRIFLFFRFFGKQGARQIPDIFAFTEKSVSAQGTVDALGGLCRIAGVFIDDDIGVFFIQRDTFAVQIVQRLSVTQDNTALSRCSQPFLQMMG